MCFSPEASFIIGSSVATISVITLRKVAFPGEWLLALIPLVFASQQIIEGFLWLALLKPDTPLSPYWLTQIYSSYAGILWPIIAPLSILLIEPNKLRKNLMFIMLLVSLTIVFSTIKVFEAGGFSSQIINQCIRYDHSIYSNSYVTSWSYVGVTCLPFLLSSKQIIRWIGVTNIITFFIANYIYSHAYVSVWCFFAAISSGLIYFYFSQTHTNQAQPEPK